MIEDGKEWALHVKTRFHRKLATRDKRREARERWRSQERKKEQDHRQTESEDEHDESTTLFDSDSL
ncbi:hypothetical protein PHLCEN_2v2531 [Hermanssonia centrifuga]|uniref:Uncharacterized protein n=1 Tax=Hermanssonia centrifuga TaxID=98765 RepID=A0A2R6RLK4_9APHY|nr:hypothetical protein PHLCEN_2v2531 [Hermanssonia centrifuga]